MTATTLNLTELLATALNDNYVCDDIDDARELAEQIIKDGIICDEAQIQELCEAFIGCHDGFNPERDFAEEYCCETGMADPDSPLYSFVDFQDVWDRLLRFDMQTVKTKDCTYFFFNF